MGAFGIETPKPSLEELIREQLKNHTPDPTLEKYDLEVVGQHIPLWEPYNRWEGVIDVREEKPNSPELLEYLAQGYTVSNIYKGSVQLVLKTKSD